MDSTEAIREVQKNIKSIQQVMRNSKFKGIGDKFNAED